LVPPALRLPPRVIPSVLLVVLRVKLVPVFISAVVWMPAEPEKLNVLPMAVLIDLPLTAPIVTVPVVLVSTRVIAPVGALASTATALNFSEPMLPPVEFSETRPSVVLVVIDLVLVIEPKLDSVMLLVVELPRLPPIIKEPVLPALIVNALTAVIGTLFVTLPMVLIKARLPFLFVPLTSITPRTPLVFLVVAPKLKVVALLLCSVTFSPWLLLDGVIITASGSTTRLPPEINAIPLPLPLLKVGLLLLPPLAESIN